METIQFDCGIKEYRLGGGVLRFNPADPNLYARFAQAGEKLRQVEQEVSGGEGDTLDLMTQADSRMKQVLSWVFGPGNDMDKLLGGVNLLAVASNGRRVMENLLAALEPVLLAGAEACVRQKTQEAVDQAKRRRGEV